MRFHGWVLLLLMALASGCASEETPDAGAPPPATAGPDGASGDPSDVPQPRVAGTEEPAAASGAIVPDVTVNGTTFHASISGAAGEWVLVAIPFAETLDPLRYSGEGEWSVGPGAAGDGAFVAPLGWVTRGAQGTFLTFAGFERHTVLLPEGASEGPIAPPAPQAWTSSGDPSAFVFAFGATRAWTLDLTGGVEADAPLGGPVVLRGAGLTVQSIPLTHLANEITTFSGDASVGAGWTHVELLRGEPSGDVAARAIRYRVGLPDGAAWPPADPLGQLYLPTGGAGYQYHLETPAGTTHDSSMLANRIVGLVQGPAGTVHAEGETLDTRGLEAVVVVSFPLDLAPLGYDDLEPMYAQM